MDSSTITLSIVALLLLAGGISLFFYFRSKLFVSRIRILSLEEDIQSYTAKINRLTSTLEEKEQVISALNSDLAVQRFKEENLSNKVRDLLEDETRLNKQFEILSNRILNRQSEEFIQKQTTGMENVLKPLKEKIIHFEEKIEKSTKESIERHSSLKEQIRYLSERSDQVSKDANNLARALKGDYKKQGHWGEVILESILEKSGLEKDREYFTQQTERSSEGRSLRPDIVIKLPDGKTIIVDSKVSLSAYTELVRSTDEEEVRSRRKAHSIAVRNHINGLAGKEYHRLYETESPDFVLMFIPIDTAFTAALEHDAELYNYAFDRNIVIVSSSTLLATLKTVETIWRNDKQNRYALRIADEAGKMYDKFAGFLGDMNKMGNQLETVTNTFTDSMRKLYNGTGNLVARAEKMKELGAKASKSLPASVFTMEE